jgi:hypothetical protein
MKQKNILYIEAEEDPEEVEGVSEEKEEVNLEVAEVEWEVKWEVVSEVEWEAPEINFKNTLDQKEI